MFPVWSFCREVVDGSDAVKRGGERYLPKPSGMDDEEYKAYKERAEFFNATGRTLEGLHGLMFRKNPVVNIPEGLETYLDNVDGEGSSLNQFLNDTTYDVEKTGFGGVFIDTPESSDVSMIEAEERGIYPYLTFYRAEQIINVHYKTSNRRKVLDLVVLEETEEIQTTDKYTYDTHKRYRVLELDADGIYTVTYTDEYEVPISVVQPTQYGKYMTHIPFYFLPTEKPEKPMMKDLADVNISWYRKSADIENGGHWTGVPTPYCIGYQPETQYDANGVEVPAKPVKLGGSKFVFFPMGVSQVAYLEFSGSGLNQLRSMMQDDEYRMAILGARIISAEKNGVEAAETAKIHRAGENSVLATFANEISDTWNKILLEYLSWTVNTQLEREDISVQINTDYDVSSMSAQELTALVSLWQSGGISKRQLFKNLKEGELVDNATSFEDMQSEIDEESASNPVLATIQAEEPTE